MATEPAIPVLDGSALARWGARQDLVDAFAAAYGSFGFAYLENHGVDPALREAVFAASREFHARPLAEKTGIALDRSHRGYIAMGSSTDVTSTLAQVTRPNQSESFMMMREDARAEPGVYLSGPNLWPAGLPGFRTAVEAWNAALGKLASRLLAVAFAAAGATPGAARAAMALFDPPTTWLRLLHYPPRPPAAPGDLYGSAPHTDFGCLTILAQDGAGGLQVMTPGGDWIDVPPRPGAFVVNVGDMLNILSNGRLRSTPHRVINRSGRARYSVAYFHDPHVSARIAPLPGTGRPRFEPVDFGSFLRAELEAGYEAHEPAGGR